MSLWVDFLGNKQRLIHKWAHYFPVYESYFERFRNRSIVFLEIGCGAGGSLQMWKRYFGPLAQIVGLDIRPQCKAYQEDQIAVRIGDQSDAAFLQAVAEEFHGFDIVLDDGSHINRHMRASFDILYPTVRDNGVYIVEDMHTCYLEQFGGGYKHPESFMEYCKGLLDELNATRAGELKPTAFTASTLGIHFYPSMAVFEKGRIGKRRSMRRPAPPAT